MGEQRVNDVVDMIGARAATSFRHMAGAEVHWGGNPPPLRYHLL